MAKFSKRSKDNLATCHEDLQTLFNEVIQYTDCIVICGHRGEEEHN
jgi:peptidoglycan L-alanyl-D-glutamate endopeptidase CwlK